LMTVAQFFMSPVSLKPLLQVCESASRYLANGWMRRPTASADKQSMGEFLLNLLPPPFFVRAGWRDIWKCFAPFMVKGASWLGVFYPENCLKGSEQMIL